MQPCFSNEKKGMLQCEDEIVVDMKGGQFSLDKPLEELHLPNFNHKAIKKSIDLENEMVRLKSKLLQP